VLTIKNNKIKYLESMLSMAEEDKRKQDKIIRRMTYNEVVLKKECSDTEKKNINLESTVNCLKPTCTKKDLKISTVECEINCKVEDITRLDQQINVLTNDLEDFRNKTSALYRRVREFQHQIKEYDKKEEDPKRPNTGDRQTDITETTAPTRAAPNRRLVCLCAQSTSEAVSSIPLQSYLAAIFNYLCDHFKANFS
jgi:chromosome segregation ATPase